MSQESILGPYLKPGTPIKVGGYSTRIVRYLSEGGFSHVYIARLDIPVKGSDVAVLKRIVAPDKTALAAIRTEVETMKRLKGHRHIVTYIDSHASALKTGGFEVYVLMEYCPGGGLIDFMNTRLQTRLAEWEVLKIISDTTEAVACMHYLRPPLLHRDLKIENVLISGNGDYKLCDFGSCTEPRAAATNSQERRALEEDIQKNTTIQYRSPEMVDVSRRLPIDEKSDIWALGVLLYKLCYFTTPFEAQGQLAILNAAYTFPPYPPYTDRTKRLIAVTLQENPRDRPNIYQLLAEICAMRNVPVPIPDIYTKSRSTSSRPTSRPSSRPPTAHNDDILIYDKPDIKPATSSTHAIDIVPMRRGRPERSSSPPKADPAITSQSRTSSRPNTKGHVAVGEEVEFTTKFPSLEEMNFGLDDRTPAPSSLDYDSAAINQVGEPSGSLQEPSSMNEQDESRLRQPSNPTQSRPLPITPPHNSPLELLDLEERVLKPSEVARSGGNYMRTQPDASRIEADGYVLRNTDHQANNDRRIPSSGPVPIVRPKPTHLENNQNIRTDLKKSTNPYAQVSTSPDDQPQIRPTMVNRASQTSPKRNQGVQTQTSPAKKEPLPRMTKEPNVSSNLIRDSSGLLISRGTSRNEGTSSMPAQSKPQFRFTTSLDRPNDNMLAQEEVMRSKSAQGARPQTIHVGSGIDFLRDLDSPLTSTTRSGSLEIVRTGGSQISHPGQDEAGPSTGYLDVQQASSAGASIRRSVSVNGPNNRHHKRPSISSIPSFSGAAKNIMNGKFSDAFKKFEASGKSRGTTPVMERSNPLMVAEDDLPAHITQHLQSSEARRSSSYSRNRPSIELLSGESVYKPKLEKTESIESTSTSVREAMRKLKEKANQKYVPQRSAQGYGKYTEPDGLHRAATVIPYSRPTTSEKSSAAQIASQVHGAHKNARRYGLQDDDEDKSFSNRFPALNDDFKV